MFLFKSIEIIIRQMCSFRYQIFPTWKRLKFFSWKICILKLKTRLLSVFFKVKVISDQKELSICLFFFCFILSNITPCILHLSELIYFRHIRCQIWLCWVSELEARKHSVIEKSNLLELVDSWTRVM